MQKRISTRTGTALPRPGIARAECYTREELAAQMGRSLITLSRWHRERKGPPLYRDRQAATLSQAGF